MMKNPFTCLSCAIVLTFSTAAAADVACPTTPTANDAIVEISGAVPSFPGHFTYWVGNTNFYGGSALAVCVQNIAFGFQQLLA